MGGRADLTTVPPLRAPQLAGTRQALDRTQRIAVDLDGRVAALPRPDLLGALVVKACAAAGDHVRGPQRHLEELARLYRLVADPAGNRRVVRLLSVSTAVQPRPGAEPAGRCRTLWEERLTEVFDSQVRGPVFEQLTRTFSSGSPPTTPFRVSERTRTIASNIPGG
jgi:hypothetical protein